MSDFEYVGEPGARYARWVEAQTPAGQARARQIAKDEFAVSAHLAYERRCYERYALVVWARTPEAQETAARAKTIGLFDAVSPDAGPVCPPKALADPDLCDWTNPTAEALSGAHSAGDAGSSAPRPGRWRRWWGG